MKHLTSTLAQACRIGGVAGLFAASAVAAQQNPPAVTVGGDTPSVSASQAPRSSSTSIGSGEEGPISVAPPENLQTPTTPLTPTQVGAGDDGTTVVGDKEAPIGLFITPWKDGYAEHGLDRPARFVDVDTSPIDPDTFQRRVNYYNVITDYRQAHLASGK